MNTKDKNERLSLALKKNLKKRKLFQKKNKKKCKTKRYDQALCKQTSQKR